MLIIIVISVQYKQVGILVWHGWRWQQWSWRRWRDISLLEKREHGRGTKYNRYPE